MPNVEIVADVVAYAPSRRPPFEQDSAYELKNYRSAGKEPSKNSNTHQQKEPEKKLVKNIRGCAVSFYPIKLSNVIFHNQCYYFNVFRRETATVDKRETFNV